MRFLLTSEGITTATIAEEVHRLSFRPIPESRVAFVPTSGNLKDMDKRWLLAHMNEVEALGFAIFDIVDIAALPPEVLRRRLTVADVLVFGGGDTAYLMNAIDESGIAAYLADLLEARLYVGISAGSIVAGPDTTLGGSSQVWSDTGEGDAPGRPALGLVQERVRPHYKRADHPQVTVERLQAVSRTLDGPVYALDDHSALVVADGTSRVVGDGEWRRFD